MKNIALLSPNQNAYSETFIQAHKDNINGKIFYYYQGSPPQCVEGYGQLCRINLRNKIKNILLRFIGISAYQYNFERSLKKHRIDRALIEYGTNAANVYKTFEKLNIPFVVIFHGYDIFTDSIVDRNLESYKEIFIKSLNVVCVSKKMQSKLISLGCPENKIIYTPCAPNPEFYKIAPNFSEPKSFIAIGRFVNKKAPYLTILAFKKVVEKYPDAILYFGGDGMLYETCFNLVEVLKLENNIKFLGVINRDEFINYLKKVSGYIQHSVTSLNGDSEGTPVTVLEASLAGVPVISTKHSGINDVIVDGVTGFLVDEKDVVKMSEKIIDIIENPTLAKKMGAAGKEYIQQNYNMDIHIKLIEKALEL